MVNGASPGPRPSGPGPGQQFPAHPVQLADVGPSGSCARKVAQGGWRLDPAVENTGRPPGAQRIGVVDAIAARQGRGNQGQHLVAGVGPARRATEIEVMVYEFPQAQVWSGEGGRKEQTGIGHQSAVVEGDLDPVGVVAC